MVHAKAALMSAAVAIVAMAIVFRIGPLKKLVAPTMP
jgi:hypothetical protein